MSAVQVQYSTTTEHIRQEDIERIGGELAALAERHDGGLDAVQVVDAARDPASALHRYFEWDDSAAAAEYRLDQARAVIRSIKVTVVTKPGPNPERTVTRAFHHVRISAPDEEPIKRYMPLQTVTSRQNLLDQVIANAARELAGWRERYRTYQSFDEFRRFQSVIQEIDRLTREKAA